jgi:hypothetical protein
MIDFSTITPDLIFGLVLLAFFGAVKYGEQTWGPNPTTWSWKKYAQVFVAALVVTVMGYLLTGVMQVATIAEITQWLTPALSLVGATLLSLYGAKYVVKVGNSGSLTNPVPVTPPANDGISDYGTSLTPSFQSGTSPFVGVVNIQCAKTVSQWIIDWLDGSPVQMGGFDEGTDYYTAQAAHQYSYVVPVGGKYDSHTFYPTITIVGKDGDRNVFNIEGTESHTGRAVSICVFAKVPA